MVWYAVLYLLATCSAVYYLDKGHCGVCKPSLCPLLSNCPVGGGLDPCGCCWECSKQRGDKCGGRWKLFGRCGQGMTCRRAGNNTLLQLTEFVGKCGQPSEQRVGNPCASNPCPVHHQCWPTDGHYVCKHVDVTCSPKRAFSECKTSLEQKDGVTYEVVNCSLVMSCLALSSHTHYDQCYNKDLSRVSSVPSVKCINDHPGCPWDSSVYRLDILKNGCCRDISYCRCNQRFCDSVQPATCDLDFERITVKQSNGRPGSCCNLTVCRRKSPRTVGMSDVECPKIDTATLTCPTDSIPVGVEKSSDMCVLGVVCQCQPCRYSCEADYYPRLLTHGTGIPGDCCHRYVCNKDEKSCITTDIEQEESGYVYKKNSYSSGYRRNISVCEYALCTNGYWSFERVYCKSDKQTGPNCVHVDGECCSVCFNIDPASVVSSVSVGHCQTAGGPLFYDGAVWRPGDCVVCHCVKGVISCVRPECSELSCISPIKIKGECCPICSDQPNDTPTIARPNTSTTATVARSGTCHHRGMSYPTGSNWTLNCQTCRCGEDRLVSCQDVQCPLLNCTHTVLFQGKCCPMCQDKLVCNSDCHLLKVCDGDVVFVWVAYSCCPQCYNVSALPAMKKQRCRDVSCNSGKVCELVREKTAYGPSDLTVVDFRCISQATPTSQSETARMGTIPATALNKKDGNNCSGAGHSVRLAIRMPYNQLSKPDILSQFVQYMQSLLWQSTVNVSLKKGKPNNRTMVSITVYNASTGCLSAAEVIDTISSNQQFSHNIPTFKFDIKRKKQTAS